MLNVVSGAALVAASGGSFWYFMPRDGVVHPLAKKPFFDSMITIAIMTLLVVGFGLIAQEILG